MIFSSVTFNSKRAERVQSSRKQIAEKIGTGEKHYYEKRKETLDTEDIEVYRRRTERRKEPSEKYNYISGIYSILFFTLPQK